MSMQTSGQYFCTSCGVVNHTAVDLSAGIHQSYVEDCEICCRPNVLHISMNRDTEEIEIQAEAEA